MACGSAVRLLCDRSKDVSHCQAPETGPSKLCNAFLLVFRDRSCEAVRSPWGSCRRPLLLQSICVVHVLLTSIELTSC